jgi:hypothetical protein
VYSVRLISLKKLLRKLGGRGSALKGAGGSRS